MCMARSCGKFWPSPAGCGESPWKQFRSAAAGVVIQRSLVLVHLMLREVADVKQPGFGREKKAVSVIMSGVEAEVPHF